jgi:hypothetical protein
VCTARPQTARSKVGLRQRISQPPPRQSENHDVSHQSHELGGCKLVGLFAPNCARSTISFIIKQRGVQHTAEPTTQASDKQGKQNKQNRNPPRPQTFARHNQRHSPRPAPQPAPNPQHVKLPTQVCHRGSAAGGCGCVWGPANRPPTATAAAATTRQYTSV